MSEVPPKRGNYLGYIIIIIIYFHMFMYIANNTTILIIPNNTNWWEQSYSSDLSAVYRRDQSNLIAAIYSEFGRKLYFLKIKLNVIIVSPNYDQSG